MSSLSNNWMLFGGFAAITLALSLFTHIRALLRQLVSRIVVNISVSGHQADAVLMYASKHFRASRFGPRAYTGWKFYYRPAGRTQLLALEVNAPAGRLYWRGWFPIWIAGGTESSGATNASGASSGTEEPSYTLAVTFPRGTLDADQLILQATEYYNQQTQRFDATGGHRHTIKYIHGSAGMSVPQFNSQRSRPASAPSSNSDVRSCLIHRPLGFSFADIGTDPEACHQAINRLALSNETRRLVEEVRRWRETQRWHQERNLPWRRGFLLYGPPGTGKTALARAIAEDLDLPIHVFDLASLRNDELQKAWNQMLEETPCMALMEDVDAVFEGRKNVAVASGPALTFDCLLNVLDGIQKTDGLLTIMTTNHIEKIDPAIGQPGAIGTRPGRIDRVVHLGALDDAGRRKIASRILASADHYIDVLCEMGKNDTPAQFQDRCVRVALAIHYGDEATLQELQPIPPLSSEIAYLRASIPA